jgi:TolB-like protein/tetratricopeptide (TPR) repeat protein
MATIPEQHERMRVGSLELDLGSRELLCGGRRIRLQEQPFEILRLMLERPGGVVTRDELRQRLWPEGTFVDFEHSLNAAIKRLRSALGDDAEHPRYVETVPRRGYRFIARSDEDAGLCAATADLTPPRARLAVLPFLDLGESVRAGYFADGLTEEMITQLGQMCRDRLGVISRTSSMAFRDTRVRAREIGEALRVEYLLEGSVRRQGDRVRIVASLVQASSETHLWTETYETPLVDALTVQQDVAARIAQSLAIELTAPPRERHLPSEPEAHQAYLKGRHYWNMVADSGADQAVAYLERATALDPSSAANHAGLARARILQAEYYRALPRTALEAARLSATRARTLDPTFYESHLAVGEIRKMLDWDWQGAESSYAQAIMLNPSHAGPHRAYALLLSALSRSDEAIRESERACDMDPFCVVVNGSGAAWVRFVAGDYDAAITRAREAVEMEPEYVPVRRILAAAHLQAGHKAQAIAELERALARAGTDLTVIAELAYARACLGERGEARALLERVTGRTHSAHTPHYPLALALMELGDLDAACAALQQAAADREPMLVNIAVDPRFERMRSHPRVIRLMEQMTL